MSTSNMEFLFKCQKCKTSPLICTSGSLGLGGKQKGEKKQTLNFIHFHCAYEARSRNMKLTVLKVNEIQDSSVCVRACVRERRGG